MLDGEERSEASMLPDDQNVLRVFQEYLMTPGKMLCFYGQNLERHRNSLTDLAANGMLKAEEFEGGYSLTIKGYEAMQHL